MQKESKGRDATIGSLGSKTVNTAPSITFHRDHYHDHDMCVCERESLPRFAIAHCRDASWKCQNATSGNRLDKIEGCGVDFVSSDGCVVFIVIVLLWIRDRLESRR